MTWLWVVKTLAVGSGFFYIMEIRGKINILEFDNEAGGRQGKLSIPVMLMLGPSLSKAHEFLLSVLKAMAMSQSLYILQPRTFRQSIGADGFIR
ncbi:hypothetical protein FNV43_RR10746 [Rhamnella rubrinervis]|uniref:Uncharacterized protein n=1 Tax=Rhamnella rubrinervis TaxID=2594499 RepID=A0A8K0H4H9_9ROSA|nr:hypothetical protein FNV43_RR10746 [Rhamnella rubrinervis]